MPIGDRDYTGLFAEEMDLLSDDEFSAYESEHADELAAVRATHATLRAAERTQLAADLARVRSGDFSIQFADTATLARWDAERLSDQGPAWGEGKTEAEFMAEIQRRVSAWDSRRDTKALNESATELKAVVDASNREALIEEAKLFAVTLDEYFGTDDLSISELEKAVVERRQRDRQNRASEAEFWSVLDGRSGTREFETGVRRSKCSRAPTCGPYRPSVG